MEIGSGTLQRVEQGKMKHTVTTESAVEYWKESTWKFLCTEEFLPLMLGVCLILLKGQRKCLKLLITRGIVVLP